MTLLEFVSTLSTQNINVAVVDSETETNIIEFKSQGIAGVEGDVSSREVKKWSISGATSITVELKPSNP